jgi:hypothetical protein
VVDSGWVARETAGVRIPGSSRQRLAQTLNAAYVDGLLSEHTLSYRLDLLFRSSLIDPAGLVGDITRPSRRRAYWAAIKAALAEVRERMRRQGTAPDGEPRLLALDWSGPQEELLLGRHHACDIVLSDPSVSRRHARLRFHDGRWMLRDLESTNGTRVNGVAVGRCALRPGDRLALGDERLVVD